MHNLRLVLQTLALGAFPGMRDEPQMSDSTGFFEAPRQPTSGSSLA